MKPLRVTTSWDDGFPADDKVAERLARHGAKGTFYVPNRNREGRPVMAPAAVRDLASTFEIGGHGRDHQPLGGLPRPALDAQIADNRAWLSDLIGRAPEGFCYVRGQVDGAVKNAVQGAGYAYARTTANLRPDPGGDPFLMPTTLQFYPHGPAVYIRNFLRQGGRASPALLRRVLTARTLVERALSLFEACLARGALFHLWGHSWEIEALGLWDDFDLVLGQIASTKAVCFMDNAEAARLTRAETGPRASADS